MKYPKAVQLDAPFVFQSGIHRAFRLVSRYLERGGRELELTGPEAHLLGYVRARSTCPLQELVQVFGHKRSTLTSMLDRLERRGLLGRQNSPVDRRSFLISLTPAGRRIADRARRLAVGLEEAITARVRSEDARAFQRVLDILAQAAGASTDPPTAPPARTRTRRRR